MTEESSEGLLSAGGYIDDLRRTGHAAYALAIAAILENQVKRAITLYMPKLSNRLSEKLFKGYGPLGSFSAKIDLARALDLISSNLSHDLHVIREARNEFAHSERMLHFDAEEVALILKKFRDYSDKIEGLTLLVSKMEDCSAELSHAIETLTLMDEVRKHGALRDKSEKPPPRPIHRARGDSDRGV